MTMTTLTAYVLGLAKEPSTWRGIVNFLTAAGLALSPDQATTIITVGLGLSGAIGALFRDGRGAA